MNRQDITIERRDHDTVTVSWSDPPRMSDGEIRHAKRRLRRELRRTLRQLRPEPQRVAASWPAVAPTPTIARATRATRTGRSTTARRVAGFSGTRRSTAARGPDADQPGEPGDIGSTPRRPREEVAE